jgi:hypothetical protein
MRRLSNHCRLQIADYGIATILWRGASYDSVDDSDAWGLPAPRIHKEV